MSTEKKQTKSIELKLSKETIRNLTTKTGVQTGVHKIAGSASGCRGGVCSTIGGARC